MAQSYREFGRDTAVHYVSGSPWQLYSPLVDFLFSPSVGFPPGSMHMKNVRTNLLESTSYKDFWKLTGFSGSATVVQKTTQITQLLAHFPNRTFTLIGDSGEHDPEIFSGIKQANPNQIIEIRIRDVTDALLHDPKRLEGMTVISSLDEGCQ